MLFQKKIILVQTKNFVSKKEKVIFKETALKNYLKKEILKENSGF